ncbi:MAG: YeeE/YedE family protein [Proteobacteria bacterium]|nr:YeeE/YedE family protein [Pseudomonadota bacterium]
MLPIQALLNEYRELGLVIGVAIGFGFGFVLERAGFGNARKLAAQFYLHDMTVFKVMFGAIITAMLGVVIASGLGWTDLTGLSESAVSYTYLWPMLVGGLVLGAGFVICGYCPGTSVVGMASGSIDAVFAFCGIILGSVLYGEIYPLVADFHFSSEKGHFFLYDWLNISAPILAVVIAVIALTMFIGAEKVEKIFQKKRGMESVQKHSRAYAFATVIGLALLASGTLALTQSEAATTPKEATVMGQEQIAKRILDEPWTMRILDLRDKEACAESRIPGSECTPKDTVKDLGLPYSSGAKDLVLVGAKTAKVPASALAYPGAVLVLKDGFDGWTRYALTKPETPAADAPAASRETYAFRSALHSAMTGRKPAPPPPATGKFVPTKKKKKGGGCS